MGTGEGYAAFYLFFTFFFAFALFNILTAIFVEKAVVAAQPDREDEILWHRRKCLEDIQEFREICNTLDLDSSGKFSKEEFQQCMSNDLIVAYMAHAGLEMHDVDFFYQVLSGYG